MFYTLKEIVSKINLAANNIRLVRHVKAKIFSSVAYRNGKADDLPYLNKFYSTDVIKQITQDMNSGKCILALAEYRDKVIGTTLAWKEKEELTPGDKWWIGGLYVLPFYRGAKIGEGLLEELRCLLKEQGIDSIFFDIAETNIKTINLSEKFLLSSHTEIPNFEKKVNQRYAKINQNSTKRLVRYAKTFTKGQEGQ